MMLVSGNHKPLVVYILNHEFVIKNAHRIGSTTIKAQPSFTELSSLDIHSNVMFNDHIVDMKLRIHIPTNGKSGCFTNTN